MKEVIKKYNVYEYNELDEKIKEKLLEKEIDNCINDYCEFMLEKDMTCKAKELLKEYFGEKSNFYGVYYDLSYCQGGGAMIAFNGTYCGKNFKIKNNSRYCHEYSFTIDNDIDFTDNQEKQLKAKIVDMNIKLKSYGYNLLNYENFIDLAEENLSEKEFLENGEIFE